MTIDAHILSMLRAHRDGISGEEISHQTGISRAAVWSRIEALRTLGFDIAANPHQGYRLIDTPDCLVAADLLARTDKALVIGRDIRVVDQAESTNDLADEMARDGLPEGTVIFADTQTHGRGRMGRSWSSVPGKGLWFSVILRPALSPTETTRLTAAAAIALVRAIRVETGLAADIKWPNDILLNNRKTAGILIELHADLDRVQHVILGIGINVHHNTSDFPSALRQIATSLKLAGARQPSRPALAARVLNELDCDYNRILRGQFSLVAEEWTRHCGTLGQTVTLTRGDQTLRGRAEAIDEQGALLLRTEHGRLESVLSGDLTPAP